jgi:hypothetical protein
VQRSHIGSVVAAALELVVQLMTVPSGWVTDVVVDDMVGCGFSGRSVLSGGRGRAGREHRRRRRVERNLWPRINRGFSTEVTFPLLEYSAMTMEYCIVVYGSSTHTTSTVQ